MTVWQWGWNFLISDLAMLGCLDKYWPETGNISSDLDHVKWFFIATCNMIFSQTKNKCKTIYLAPLGKKTERILEGLCAPQELNEKSYEEIKHLLLKHLKPKYFVVTENYCLHNAKKDEGESVSNFFVHLKNLLSTCEFGTFLKKSFKRQICMWVE